MEEPARPRAATCSARGRASCLATNPIVKEAKYQNAFPSKSERRFDIL